MKSLMELKIKQITRNNFESWQHQHLKNTTYFHARLIQSARKLTADLNNSPNSSDDKGKGRILTKLNLGYLHEPAKTLPLFQYSTDECQEPPSCFPM